MRYNIFKSQIRKKFCQVEKFDYKQFFQNKVEEIKEQGKLLEENLSQEKLELFQAGYEYIKQMNTKEKQYLWLKKNGKDKIFYTKNNLEFQTNSFFDIEKDSIWSQVGESSMDQQQQTTEQVQETPQEEEKTSFDVYLENYKPADKLKIIKTLKQTMGTGLKETKDFVEKTGERQIKSGVSKADAEKMKEDLEKIGCVILIKQLIISIYNGKQSKFWQLTSTKLNTFLDNEQES